jgi:hypothetical protein
MMTKYPDIQICYSPSDKQEKQGKRSEMKKYINQGYKIQLERNGYFVLVKTAKILLRFSEKKKIHEIDISYDVKEFYDKKRVTEKLAEKIAADIKNEKVKVTIKDNRFVQISREE